MNTAVFTAGGTARTVHRRVDPDGAGPRVFLQRVPEPKTAKNRVHLDVRAAPGLDNEERMAALEAEAERLVGLGATRVRRFEPGALVPAGQYLDAVGNGSLDAAWTVAGFWTGKDIAFAMYGSVPFAMSP